MNTIRPGGRRWPEPLLALACAAVFALLAWQVASGGLVTRVDGHVRDALASFSQHGFGRELLPWAHAVCDLGDRGVALPTLAVGAALAAWLRRSARPLLLAAAAVVALFATVVPVKLILGRPGPDNPHERLDWYGYFPSGHTATALICYGTAAALLGALASRRGRRLIAGGVALMALAVGLCLVYSRFHWVSDVLASYALSVLVLWLLFRAPSPGWRRAAPAGRGSGRAASGRPGGASPAPGAKAEDDPADAEHGRDRDHDGDRGGRGAARAR